MVLKNWRMLAIAALAFPFTSSVSLASETLHAADNLTDFPTSGIVQVNTGSLLETGDFLTSGAIAGVATDGTNVFVSLPTGISEYTAAGAFVGSFSNEPGDLFGALALAGGTLYAADNLTNFPTSGIVEVNTGSLLETGDFLTSGAIAGVATDGTDVFVSLPTGISEYTAAGAFVGSFTNEPGDLFGALALAGDTLYAADNLTNFPTSGIVEVNTGSLLETGDFLDLRRDCGRCDRRHRRLCQPADRNIGIHQSRGVRWQFLERTRRFIRRAGASEQRVACGTRSPDMGNDGARFCGSKFRRLLADADAFRFLRLEFGG